MGSARTLRAGSPSSIPITLDATHRPPRAIELLRACFDRQCGTGPFAVGALDLACVRP